MVFTLCTISQIFSETTSVPDNQIQAFPLPSTWYIQVSNVGFDERS
jgi:hypothetical protein